MSEFEAKGGEEENNEGEEDRVLEWEMGLPNAGDLTPLSQVLIPPELASAFSISPEPSRTVRDVDRASQTTLSSLRCGSGQFSSNNNFKSFNGGERAPMVVEAAAAEKEEEEEEEEEENNAADRDGADCSRKLRKIDSEEADSGLRTENSGDDPSAAAARTSSKRPRLVWTPQLHKRFVDVVAHLGIKNAVPKTIMQLMNVEGLTRENVASHLQKYRLYLKRMQGLSNEGPSSSDQLFASTPVPQSLHESGAAGSGGGGNGAVHGNGHLGVSMPVPYHLAGGIMPMPVYGHMEMQTGNNNHHHHPQMNHHNHHHHHNHGFDGNSPFMFQQRDWTGSNYGPVVSYPHHPHQVAPNDNL